MIVHFIGNAGAGKTTVLKAVESVWVDTAGNGLQCRHSSLSRLSRWFLIKNCSNTLATFPYQVNTARKLRNYARNKCNVSLTFLTKLLTTELCRRRFLQPNLIFLADQALVNILRKHFINVPSKIMHDLPLPEVVVFVDAPAEQRILRILLREKQVIESDKIIGSARSSKALHFAKHACSMLGSEQAFAALENWNSRNCAPPLSNVELHELLFSIQQSCTQTKLTNRSVKTPPSEWLKPALEQQGVQWIEIDNSDDIELNVTAEWLAGRLLEAYRKISKGKC